MIGLERISFATSKYYIDMGELATIRGQDKEKYYLGLMQNKMSVIPPTEDVITLGYTAAINAIADIDKEDIGLLIFATESAIDESKSSAIYIHKFLELDEDCRVFEIKQACYGGTAALFTAYDFVASNPKRKALIIMSDVARYGLETVGEATQGGGAIAIIISSAPDIATINNSTGKCAYEIMDFWRPTGYDEAIVNGSLSSKRYLLSLKKCYTDFISKNNIHLDYFCYHTPFSKMAVKAHNLIMPATAFNQNTIKYNQEIGNCYTASLYISLASLLDYETDLDNKNIGMFSYGSGSMAEYFSIKIASGYKEHLKTQIHQALISDRTQIDISTYEQFYRSYNAGSTENYRTSGPLKFRAISSKIREYYFD